MVHSASELTLFSPETVTDGGLKGVSQRPYQVDGVASISRGMRDGGRGQLRSAGGNGNGKTVMSQRSAEQRGGRGVPVGRAGRAATA